MDLDIFSSLLIMLLESCCRRRKTYGREVEVEVEFEEGELERLKHMHIHKYERAVTTYLDAVYRFVEVRENISEYWTAIVDILHSLVIKASYEIIYNVRKHGE